MGNQGPETNQRCREEEEEKNNPRGGNGIQIDHGAETNGAGRKKKRRIIRKVARAYKFAARGGLQSGCRGQAHLALNPHASKPSRA